MFKPTFVAKLNEFSRISRNRRTICPKCRQHQGIDISYGMPGIELAEMAERGEAWLGGCCPSENKPKRHCLACQDEWQIKRRRDPNSLPSLPDPISG